MADERALKSQAAPQLDDPIFVLGKLGEQSEDNRRDIKELTKRVDTLWYGRARLLGAVAAINVIGGLAWTLFSFFKDGAGGH